MAFKLMNTNCRQATDAAEQAWPNCPDVNMVNGQTVESIWYEAARVNAPDVCKNQTRIRSCQNGIVSFFNSSKSYTYKTCSESARCSNPDAAHGATEKKTVYE